MSTDRGHPVGIPPNEGSFSSLNATAQAVIAALIADAANGPGIVRCVQSGLWGAEDVTEFTIYNQANTPEGKELFLTDIIFRSVGTQIAMAPSELQLTYKAETEPNPSSTEQIAWADLNLVPPVDADNCPIAARLSWTGGISDRVARRGSITVICDVIRAHPVWVDVIGYYVDRNEDS